MPRFFLGTHADAGSRVTFDAREARHLSRVLRLGPGDEVRALDGRGRELTVRLIRVTGAQAEGWVLAVEAPRTESPLALTLVQGLPKADKMEVIVRMATELGVSRIVPVLTARSVVRVVPGREGGRLDRWRRVAREAAKQCGRTTLPDIEPVRPLDAWVQGRASPGLLVCLWEEERARLFERLPGGPVAEAAVVVGPEGGLAASEVDRLRAGGAVVAGLGPRMLRTETAGPVAVALLQARYGDLCEPRPGSSEVSPK
jgi:16S rRNA (uracil1498-N3)-methyltransferase